LPYRDAASTIDEALGSMLEQRGVDLEIMAVDDGSTDDGPARVARLAARHSCITMLAAGGRGIVSALNLGLEHARAPLIARMDSDDISHPNRLATQLDALARAPDVAAIGTLVEAFPARHVGAGLERYVAWLNSLITPEDHAREIFVESPLCHPSVLMRRTALDAVGGYRDVPWPEDYDLWLRMDAAGLQLGKVPVPLFKWRHRSGRLTFTDPRYSNARLREARAHYLAARLKRLHRPLVVWGAGLTGKRLARALESHGVSAERFIDIDRKKIGRTARGVTIDPSTTLRAGEAIVVVAVSVLGARDLIRAELATLGMKETRDYVCAA
jgi:glycosyltransferase involved in cell wall biosynthesis